MGSHGRQLWRVKSPKTAFWLSIIAYLRHRNCMFWSSHAEVMWQEVHMAEWGAVIEFKCGRHLCIGGSGDVLHERHEHCSDGVEEVSSPETESFGGWEGLLQLPEQQELTKEHVDLLKKWVVGLVRKEIENLELLNIFSCFLSTSKVCCQVS